MSDHELQLLEKIAAALDSPHLPLSIDLWNVKLIAAYLKKSPNRVRSDIIPLPTFPRPVRLPTSENAQALYKAREVVKWAESYTST